MKIFIVDDEAIGMTRLCHLLQSFPDVEIVGKARTVDDATHLILRLKPDLVFLDVEMGRETGFDVITRVRAGGLHTRFVIVSGYSHYAITAIRYKVEDYLLKPVDLNELKTMLERVRGLRSHESDTQDAVLHLGLSKRENEVYQQLLAGKSSAEISHELFLSKHTVDTYRRKILRKTGARNTVELIRRFTH